MDEAWGRIDGTARFPATTLQYGPDHGGTWVGHYSGDVAICARCGCALEPTGVTRKGVVKGWRHAEGQSRG